MAFIGLILGHQFDRGFADRFTRFGPDLSRERLEQLPESFLRPLFQTMGFLAKADGRVTEEEIRAARKLMHRLGLGPAQARRAIGWFEEGKKPGFQLVPTIRRVRGEGARKADIRALFVRLLMEVALAKPKLHKTERSAFWVICNEFDIGRVELAQLEATLRAQRGFRKSGDVVEDSTRLHEGVPRRSVSTNRRPTTTSKGPTGA